MKYFECECGNTLFFDNSLCLQCGFEVGYDPTSDKMRRVGPLYTRCRNGNEFSTCNWLVPTGGEEYCPACRLNRTVPDTSVASNLVLWQKMEAAKRRVFYTLARLGIAPPSLLSQPTGVAFDFLVPTPQAPVITGHENGVITINLLEADDVYREKTRTALGEPYRTLVGHLRHELGHYYWDKLFLHRSDEDPLLQEYRRLFGDERADYSAALQQHYTVGAPPTWQTTHITSYATAHPWEDWAETWAQYLHILDGTETAAAFGWVGHQVPIAIKPFSPAEVLGKNVQPADARLFDALNAWSRLSPALNELAASLGHTALYPFVLSTDSVRKIAYVHKVVGIAAAEQKGKSPKDDSSRSLSKAGRWLLNTFRIGRV